MVAGKRGGGERRGASPRGVCVQEGRHYSGPDLGREGAGPAGPVSQSLSPTTELPYDPGNATTATTTATIIITDAISALRTQVCLRCRQQGQGLDLTTRARPRCGAS